MAEADEVIEARLRESVQRRSQGFDPSETLPGRIDARVRSRHRRGQVAAGSAAAGLAAVLTLLVSLAAGDRSGNGPVQMDGPGPVVTTPSTAEATTTTTTTERPPGSTTTITVEPGSTAGSTLVPGPGSAQVDLVTPLSRSGIGPIIAGMTVREAQSAAGIAVTPPSPTGSGEACVAIAVDTASITLVVELRGQAGEDVMDGIVRAVEAVARDTEEGFVVSGTPDDLVALYGQPTRVDDLSAQYGDGMDFWVWESGDFAYGATVSGDLVLGIESGNPAWLAHADGCP